MGVNEKRVGNRIHHSVISITKMEKEKWGKNNVWFCDKSRGFSNRVKKEFFSDCVDELREYRGGSQNFRKNKTIENRALIPFD